ncbi:VC0807 family protein [Actinoplanes sp. NPDC051633]|uniref:VC0807 family protein n=1 Tax=Actinoplanes sp. NPDC051633 TaxID=3155670 RepID=UPI003428B84B
MNRAAIVFDVGLPLATYYTLHGLGVSDRTALLAATAAAGVRLVWVALRTRHVTWFAAVMLSVFGAGAVLTFIGGDARVLLLKDSAPTVMLGLVFLASLLGGSPLTVSAAQSWKPAQADRVADLYRSEPAGRRAFRVSSLVWGVGLLAEAVVRVPLVYLLPVTVMVGLSTAMMLGTLAALFVWNAIYLTRAARRSPELSILVPSRA